MWKLPKWEIPEEGVDVQVIKEEKPKGKSKTCDVCGAVAEPLHNWWISVGLNLSMNPQQQFQYIFLNNLV